VAVRRRRPDWEAKELLAVAARRDPHADWPRRSTVCTALKDRDFVTPRRRPGGSALGSGSQHAPGT
jgi:hypothetical protein